MRQGKIFFEFWTVTLLLITSFPGLTLSFLTSGNSNIQHTTTNKVSHFTSVSQGSSSLLPTNHHHVQLSSSTKKEIRTSGLYSSFSDNDDDDGGVTGVGGRALGILVLMTVPLSWGTYAPVVRYVYEIDPPVPGFVFSAGYYLVASLSLLTLANLTDKQQQQQDVAASNTDNAKNENAIIKNSPNDDSTSSLSTLPIQGGLELGVYLFLGNALQVIGLKTVPADRAAFLVQLTTVMVPLVSAATTGSFFSIPLRTWIACLLAFSGVIVMGFDGKEISGDLSSSLSSITDTFTGGDLLIVLAAFVYTLHVVRLGRYAPSTTPISLAASKATTEAILSIGLVLGLLACTNGDTQGLPSFVAETGNDISNFFTSIGNAFNTNSIPMSTLLPAAGAILWTGWVTCAYTIYAQSFGQSRVSPTDANLIYTTQPLFSALFAWVILGETLGEAGYIGAALIGVALWLVTGTDDSTDKGEREKLEFNVDDEQAFLPISFFKDKLQSAGMKSKASAIDVEKIKSTR